MFGGQNGGNFGIKMEAGGDLMSVTYTDVMLPPRQQLARQDALTAERLFLVAYPDTFPEEVLNDLFCRFGELIDVRWIKDKTFGYARFASKSSAQNAIKMLHQREFCNRRLKVMIAEPSRKEMDNQSSQQDHKRQKNSTDF